MNDSIIISVTNNEISIKAVEETEINSITINLNDEQFMSILLPKRPVVFKGVSEIESEPIITPPIADDPELWKEYVVVDRFGVNVRNKPELTASSLVDSWPTGRRFWITNTLTSNGYLWAITNQDCYVAIRRLLDGKVYTAPVE